MVAEVIVMDTQALANYCAGAQAMTGAAQSKVLLCNS